MTAAFLADPGNICITETSRVSGELRDEEDLMASATRATKTLFGELLSLPKKSKPGKPGEGHFEVTALPAPIMRRPREKAPPKEKPLSAWDKFALKKGISLNRKKNNKQWNEARQEWQDKWGKRAREAERNSDWIREIPKNYVPGAQGDDPFIEDKREKKEKLAKAKKNQERNERRVATTQRAQAEAASINKTVGKLKTASMGKFDKSAVKAGKKLKR
jgi:regulator of ribosome biosynthesis